MADWVLPVISLVVGLSGGVVGAYVGMKVGLVRQETLMEDVRRRVESMHTRIHDHNNDILIHDMEIEEIMRKVDIPRVRRQKVRP